MNRLKNQAGFETVAVIVVVLVLAVIGVGSYKFLSLRHAANTTPVTSTQASTTVPATIKTTADLQATGVLLDSSSAQLDSSLDDSALDADLDAML